MTVKELISKLSEFPKDYDVLVADDNGLYEVLEINEWLHFQTNEKMNAVILEPGSVI